MKTKLSLAVSLALLSAGLLTGCSDDNEPTAADAQQEATKNLAAPMLKYIPANSPYFMASRESLPEQDVFDLYQRTQPMAGLDSDLDELRDLLPDIDDEALRSMITLLIAASEEALEVETLEDVHALGLKINPQVAIYGLGVLPVMRMQLQDEDAFRETLQRILTKADITPNTATTNGTDYWVLTPEAPVKAILAIVDQQLVLSMVPQDASDELLAQVLGNTLPDSNIGETGELEELEQRHGFTPYGAGQLSFARLLNELSEPSHAGTQALLEATDSEQPDLSNCQADIDRITSRFPGVVIGSREYKLDRMEMNFILETDEEIVSDLRALTTQVPGLGSTEGMASIGLGLDLPMLVQTVQKYAQQVRDNPFSCNEMQELNSAWDEANLAINNPITMMVGQSLSGFNARINSLTMKNGEPFVTGILTLASQNPLTLLTTASSFAPELGALGLKPGGEAKQIESMMLPPDAPALYAAMSETAIALGAGISDSATLQKELEAPASDRDLLLYGHITGEFYNSLANVIEQTPSDEISASDIEMIKQFGEAYENMEYWFRVDDAGVEMSFSLELN
ncbi:MULTISPECIES: hypothetical protein [unclassified Halomonas]|uniref:hypothetical protein n=1 Tax=unclassified Halomonas TaxID=2609666 RepID=UPI0007D8D896|nr:MULTISPECIES: hypothetical protein [unclassified Halomonas]MBT2785278.1 hypothetical protein [Halomonas sp. ISL-106]MBT2799299.1 hypothetical protein [Halomonas sp. ISL-104]OAL59562.1 hypothetical protein A6R74_02680 [Halomonas sp. ALS9]